MIFALLYFIASILGMALIWSAITRSQGRWRWARKWMAAFPVVLAVTLFLKANGPSFWWFVPAWSVHPVVAWTCLGLQAFILMAGALHLVINISTEAVLRLNSRRVQALETDPQIGYRILSEGAGQAVPPQIYACRHPGMNLPDSSPQVHGIVRPMILVPASWVPKAMLEADPFFADVAFNEVSPKAWRQALAHELAHIGELDGLTYFLMKVNTLFVWKGWIYGGGLTTEVPVLKHLSMFISYIGYPLRHAIDQERDRQEALADQPEAFFDEDAMSEVIRLREAASLTASPSASKLWPLWAGLLASFVGFAMSLLLLWASPGRGQVLRMISPDRPILGALPLNWRLRGEQSLVGKFGLVPANTSGRPATLMIQVLRDLPPEHDSEPGYPTGFSFGGALNPGVIKDAVAFEVETEVEFINAEGKPDKLPNAAQQFSLVIPAPTPSNPTLKAEVVFGGQPDHPENPVWPSATREGRSFIYLSRRNLDKPTPAERMEWHFKAVFKGTYYVHQPKIRVITRDGKSTAILSE